MRETFVGAPRRRWPGNFVDDRPQDIRHQLALKGSIAKKDDQSLKKALVAAGKGEVRASGDRESIDASS